MKKYLEPTFELNYLSVVDVMTGSIEDDSLVSTDIIFDAKDFLGSN